MCRRRSWNNRYKVAKHLKPSNLSNFLLPNFDLSIVATQRQSSFVPLKYHIEQSSTKAAKLHKFHFQLINQLEAPKRPLQQSIGESCSYKLSSIG